MPRMLPRPREGDHAPFFQAYVDRVPDGCVYETLEHQGRKVAALLRGIDEAQGAFRYAPGKWTVKQLVQHVIDGERLFGYRAMCIARGETASLPGFDEDHYASNDGSAQRSVASLAAEHAAVRAATLTLFRGFDAAAWARRGIANHKPLAVISLPWITAGHELHHLSVLRERYGVSA